MLIGWVLYRKCDKTFIATGNGPNNRRKVASKTHPKIYKNEASAKLALKQIKLTGYEVKTVKISFREG